MNAHSRPRSLLVGRIWVVRPRLAQTIILRPKNLFNIQFEHVRAHRGHSMNERADKLADLGAQTTTHFRAGRPLRQRETYQYSSSLPRPTIRPILPPDTVPD